MELIILERCEFVEDLVEPVDVGLCELRIVLAGGESDFFFILYALCGVHQVPVAVCELGESELGAELDACPFCHTSAFGRDNHHTVGCSRSVD